MPLQLVGETIDKTRSHYLAETGKIVQLMRGIYVDAGDDIEQTVLAHAVRIARYLYPRAYLSGASAILLGPTRDGRLYLSGQRVQRTHIRSLEIIQNKAPVNPSVASAIVADSLGEFSVSVSGVRQRFLEAFRIRSEHAASIEAAMRETIAARLIEEYGSPKAASDAVWSLARENQWFREGERAEKALLQRPAAVAAKNAAAFDLHVAWHGRPVGMLTHDGFEWRWSVNTDGPALPPIVRQTVPGRLPPFIVSLLPEGWLDSVLKEGGDERALVRSGRRYLSNISIAATVDELARLPADTLTTKFARFSTDGLFTGTYAGPGRSTLERDFEHRLAALYAIAETPRLSGVQIKAPMHLDAEGKLSPSVALPFTHILKPGGTSGFDSLPLVEWIGLTLARAVGLTAPDAVLLRMPDGLPPALVVERLDIREQAGDPRWIALEDMALLKVAHSGDTAFRSVRLAPVYDTLTTRVFPGLAHDRMALKLGGKDERLRRADFVALATLAGLRAQDAQAAIDDVLQRLRLALDALVLPRALALSADARATVDRTLELCRSRVAVFD